MDTITMTGNHPPGQQSAYPDEYSPKMLVAIARAENRAALGLGPELAFHGVDIWNAWELTWLSNTGKPGIATVETMKRLTRDADYRHWTSEFLGGE